MVWVGRIEMIGRVDIKEISRAGVGRAKIGIGKARRGQSGTGSDGRKIERYRLDLADPA